MNKFLKMMSVIALGSGLILAPISPIALAEQPTTTEVQDGVNVHVLDGTGTKDSIMNNFMEGTQAQLVTENGVKYIQVTEKMASAWESFTINGVEAQVVTHDSTNDTRVVRFVYSGENTVNAHVVVNAPALNYHGSYDVILQLSNVPQKAVQPETIEETTSQEVAQPTPTETTSQEVTQPTPTETTSQEVTQPTISETTENVYLLNAKATEPTYSSMQSYIENTAKVVGDKVTLKFVKRDSLEGFSVNGQAVTINEDGTATFTVTSSDVETTFDINTGQHQRSYPVKLHIGKLAQEPIVKKRPTEKPSTETTKPTETTENVYLLNAKATEPTYSSMQSYIENTAKVVGDKVTLKFVKRDSLEGFSVNGQAVTINEDGTATFTTTSSDVETTFDINTGQHQRSYPVKLHIGKLAQEPIVKKRPTEKPSTETTKPTETTENVYLLNAKATEPTYSSMQSYIENMAKVVKTSEGNKVTLKFVRRDGIAGFNVNGQAVTIDKDGTATFIVNTDDVNTTFDVKTGNYKNSYPVKLHIGKLAQEPIVKKRPTEKPSTETAKSIEPVQPIAPVTPTEKPSTSQSVTNVAQVFKYGTQELSKMADYIKSLQIVEMNGKKYVQMTIDNASVWQSFNVEGQPVIEVSYDMMKDRKVVMFEYTTGKQQYASQVHIVIPSINYDNTYNVTINIPTTSQQIVPQVTQPNELMPSLIEKTNGQTNVIKANNVLRAFKYGTSQISVMDGYIDSSEIVNVNGVAYVQLVINNASSWRSFVVEGQSVDIVSTDAINDRQIVRFVYNKDQALYNAQVHIVVPSLNYDNVYNVTLLVDETGVQTGERQGGVASIKGATNLSTTGLKKGVAKSGLLPKSGESNSFTMTYIGSLIAFLGAIILFVRRNKKSN